MDNRTAARKIIEAALAAVDPYRSVFRSLTAIQARRIFVVGAGKASARMAEAAEAALGDRIVAGWVNTKYGHGAELRRIHCHECGHPVPDEAGVFGAQQIANLARSAGEGDLVVVLLSGGGSALMPLPAAGVSLAVKQETTRRLLDSGANIHEMNAVRKHLSAIKGGRLAQLAAPAEVLCLILSDVIGDDVGTIGSGPTAPDPSTLADAHAILRRYNIPDPIPEGSETPKPGDPVLNKVCNLVVSNNRAALQAAAHKARNLGFHTLLLATTISGETREVASMHAAILREVCVSGNPAVRPACILSGGETTVTIRGAGKGGRNQEFALAAALEIADLDNVLVASFGTDGTDGPTDAAGAYADGSTTVRAANAGYEATRNLDNNDAYPLFEAIGDLLITGPTRTNVMDIYLLLAGPATEERKP
jgi:hydroxypyruvate reductase